MDKKYIILILAIVFLLWFTSKAKAKPASSPLPTPTPTPEPTPTPAPIDAPVDLGGGGSGTFGGGYGTTFYAVKSGDTWYKLASWIWPAEAGTKTKEKVLKFAEQNATANGFKWNLFDSKVSSDLRDPDTLHVGQKLVLWTWSSFEDNAPGGALAKGQQGNAFNSWDILI